MRHEPGCAFVTHSTCSTIFSSQNQVSWWTLMSEATVHQTSSNNRCNQCLHTSTQWNLLSSSLVSRYESNAKYGINAVYSSSAPAMHTSVFLVLSLYFALLQTSKAMEIIQKPVYEYSTYRDSIFPCLFHIRSHKCSTKCEMNMEMYVCSTFYKSCINLVLLKVKCEAPHDALLSIVCQMLRRWTKYLSNSINVGDVATYEDHVVHNPKPHQVCRMSYCL